MLGKPRSGKAKYIVYVINNVVHVQISVHTEKVDNAFCLENCSEICSPDTS